MRSPKTTTDWPVAAFRFRGCALYGAAPHLPLGETRDGFNEGWNSWRVGGLQKGALDPDRGGCRKIKVLLWAHHASWWGRVSSLDASTHPSVPPAAMTLSMVVVIARGYFISFGADKSRYFFDWSSLARLSPMQRSWISANESRRERYDATLC